MGQARIGTFNTQLARAGAAKAALGEYNLQVLRRVSPTSKANIGTFCVQVARIRDALYLYPPNKTLSFATYLPYVGRFVDHFAGTNESPKNLDWDIISNPVSPHTLLRNNNSLQFTCVDGGATTAPEIRSRFYVDGDFEVIMDTAVTYGPQEDAFGWYVVLVGETTGRIDYNGARWYTRNRFHIYENNAQVAWWDHGGAIKTAQMRIVRSGNSFSYYYDVDNNGWQFHSTRTLTMSNRVFFGIKGYYNSANYGQEIGRVYSFVVNAPNIVGRGYFYPAVKATVFTGYAPTVSTIIENQIGVPSGTITFSGQALDQMQKVLTVPHTTLTYIGQTPDPGAGYVIEVDGSSFAFTGYEPTTELVSQNFDEVLGMLSISIEN